MVNIIDCNIDEFLNRTKGKRLFLFGGGTKAERYYKYLSLEDRVEAIIDNNEKLCNTNWNGAEQVEVIALQDFIEKFRNQGLSTVAILITPIFGVTDIIEQLNSCEELRGVDCYVGCMMVAHYIPQEFSFTLGAPRIPKKIHYCWFGKTEIPNHLREYMESWKKYCPDYEIIRWDESNYDVTKNRYMYEAYQNQQWGFVPDYARLDIIYEEGGIYLDTDVELVANLDKLLNDEMFCGELDGLAINFGSGFGAVKNDLLIKECRDTYDDLSFYRLDRSLNLRPCAEYQTPVLERNGFKICNEYQRINGRVVYPSEVLNPIMNGQASVFTERTVSIHHGEMSWTSEGEKSSWNKYIRYMRNNHCGGGCQTYE